MGIVCASLDKKGYALFKKYFEDRNVKLCKDEEKLTFCLAVLSIIIWGISNKTILYHYGKGKKRKNSEKSFIVTSKKRNAKIALLNINVWEDVLNLNCLGVQNAKY